MQESMSARVTLTPLPRPPRTIAGIDVSNEIGSDQLSAAVIVFSYPDLHEVDHSFARVRDSFAYVPGYLSFREEPVISKAFARLRVRPDLLMVDGQGIAHPRSMGIATHLGLVLNTPSLGVAKSVLYGRPERVPTEPGESARLLHPVSNETIGMLLLSKANTNPIVVSPGHRITMHESVQIVRMCLRGYRTPIPTRTAHVRVNEYRRLSTAVSRIS